jgi:NADP-dependent 3-hydroxy acid dehydrogenase YdfG
MEGTTPRARVAVVTGASSGIGAATARALSEAGLRVALLARRADRIESLAAELNARRRDDSGTYGHEIGPSALAVEADVTDRAALDAAAARVGEELGGADVLVNNAGQMLLAPFEADRAEETRRMVEVNLLGAMNATAAFLPQLRRAGGDVVNVSSLSGRSADRTTSVYSATKWGMIGWSEVLRRELAPAVRVLLVEPGLVATELSSHTSDEASRAALQGAQDRIGSLDPAAVAGVIAYAVGLPHEVALSEIVVRPTSQP